MFAIHAARKFTAIWQSETPHERDYVEEIFGQFIGAQVFDGAHAFVCDDAILFDAFIGRQPRGYYERFRGKNAFLVHFLDENYDGGYERYGAFRGVFRKHWAAIFETGRIWKLPLGYCNGFKRQGPVAVAAGRGYLWSFAGAAGKASRPGAIRALAGLGPYAVHASDGFCARDVAIRHQRLTAGESAALLRDSVFAPSPMGNTNLECFRLYEALEAGAIPLVERRWTLDYFGRLFGAHPIPAFGGWDEAARFVTGIRNEPERLNELQVACLTWWDGFKVAMRSEAGAVLEAGSSEAPRLAFPYSKVWQYGELLRHQNFASLKWRVGRNLGRVLRTGRFRDG